MLLNYNKLHMDNNSFFKRLASKSVTSETPEYKIDLAKTETSEAKIEAKTPEEPIGQLTVDIYHTPNDIVIQSAIAGAKPEDIDVNVTPDSISIAGMRRQEPESPDVEYLHQECYWGKFARSIILPEEVDPENANVNFKNGILSVRLPKTNRKKGKKLEVKMD
jgi:HSP20 family molecular chaperone IbpA